MMKYFRSVIVILAFVCIKHVQNGKYSLSLSLSLSLSGET